MNRNLLLLILSLAFSFPATVQAQSVAVESLRGLKGVQVGVEEMEADLQSRGLVSDELRGRIEGKLRAARIRVDVGPKVDGAVLYIRVRGSEFIPGTYAMQMRLEVQQVVYLARNPKMTVMGSTWRKEDLVVYAGGNARSSLGVLDRLVDEFIADMQRANVLLVRPKSATHH